MPSSAGASGTSSAAASPVPSILDPRVAGGSHEGLLAVYSLSKQSNVAGYRAAFVAGDPAIMANLVNSRKHAGMIVPYPVQEAMRVALGDDAHVAAQKDLYRGRRERIVPALETLRADHPRIQAGLYLWATAGEATWDTVGRLADRGIVVGPGVFYGDAGNGFIRVALTATDERIDAAVGTAQRRGRNNAVTRATSGAFWAALTAPRISATREVAVFFN